MGNKWYWFYIVITLLFHVIGRVKFIDFHDLGKVSIEPAREIDIRSLVKDVLVPSVVPCTCDPLITAYVKDPTHDNVNAIVIELARHY